MCRVKRQKPQKMKKNGEVNYFCLQNFNTNSERYMVNKNGQQKLRGFSLDDSPITKHTSCFALSKPTSKQIPIPGPLVTAIAVKSENWSFESSIAVWTALSIFSWWRSVATRGLIPKNKNKNKRQISKNQRSYLWQFCGAHLVE